MQRHQSRRNQESPSSFECPTGPFITPTKKHWWPRHDWLVSLVGRRGSFLRRFCQQCQRIWQHCSLRPGVDSWFLGIPMSHMWYLPMYVLVCWLLQRRKPWRWAFFFIVVIFDDQQWLKNLFRPSYIYSCSIDHILEHAFCYLGCWAVLGQ